MLTPLLPPPHAPHNREENKRIGRAEAKKHLGQNKAKHSFLPPLPQFLELSMTLYGRQYPSGLLKSAVWAVRPSNFLPNPSLTC